MSHDGQHLRRAAVKSFFESLDKLQTELDDTSVQPDPSQPVASKTEKNKRAGFNLHELEEAVADIEQFFQQQNQQSTASME